MIDDQAREAAAHAAAPRTRTSHIGKEVSMDFSHGAVKHRLRDGALPVGRRRWRETGGAVVFFSSGFLGFLGFSFCFLFVFLEFQT